jgi:hypothetical protein
VLTVFLETVDAAVDRFQAEDRSTVVSGAMKGVSFSKSYEALPTYCLALMQNASPGNQEALAFAIAKLKDSNMEEDLKSLSLGLELMNVVGPGVVLAAVGALGDRIRVDDSAETGSGAESSTTDAHVVAEEIRAARSKPIDSAFQGHSGAEDSVRNLPRKTARGDSPQGQP